MVWSCVASIRDSLTSVPVSKFKEKRHVAMGKTPAHDLDKLLSFDCEGLCTKGSEGPDIEK